MNKVQIGKKTIHAPGEWNELSEKQLLIIAPVVMNFLGYVNQIKIPYLQKEEKHRTEILIVKYLLGVPWSWITKRLDAAQVTELCELTKPFLDNISLTDTLIKTVTTEGIEYHGPGDMMGLVSVDEFGFADTFFRKWIITQDYSYLEQMIACLYREKRQGYDPGSASFQGDIREDFNRYKIEPRAEKFKSLPLKIKAALLLQFWGARDWMVKAHKNVFTTKKQSGKGFGWGGFLIELAGAQFGDVYKTRSAKVIDVMGFCEISAVRATEQKRKIKSK